MVDRLHNEVFEKQRKMNAHAYVNDTSMNQERKNYDSKSSNQKPNIHLVDLSGSDIMEKSILNNTQSAKNLNEFMSNL
jgi:predicted RNA-binding protein with PUA-like domain